MKNMRPEIDHPLRRVAESTILRHASRKSHGTGYRRLVVFPHGHELRFFESARPAPQGAKRDHEHLRVREGVSLVVRQHDRSHHIVDWSAIAVSFGFASEGEVLDGIADLRAVRTLRIPGRLARNRRAERWPDLSEIRKIGTRKRRAFNSRWS